MTSSPKASARLALHQHSNVPVSLTKGIRNLSHCGLITRTSLKFITNGKTPAPNRLPISETFSLECLESSGRTGAVRTKYLTPRVRSQEL